MPQRMTRGPCVAAMHEQHSTSMPRAPVPLCSPWWTPEAPLHSAHSLSPLHRPSRSLPLARRGCHGSRRRAPRPPPSARLRREPRASAPSPSPSVHVEPLSHLPPSPMLFVLGAADVAADGCRGRTATSRLEPSWVALWVRAGPLFLPRHSTTAVGPSPAATGRFPDLLCSQL